MKELDILGRGGSLVLWNGRRKDVKVWAINHAFLKCNCKVDRIFCLHDLSEYDPDKLRDVTGDYYKGLSALNNSGAEIVTLQTDDQLIKNVLYPIAWVEELTQSKYFINALAYSLALAYCEGFHIVNLYGTDFGPSCNDVNEIKGVEYWIGFLRGSGLEVNIPILSKLCPEYRYQL